MNEGEMNLPAKLLRFKYRATTAKRTEWYANALLAFLEQRPNQDVPRDEIKAHCKAFDIALGELRRRGHTIRNVGSGGYGKGVRRSAYRLVV